jgi:hypothetical protein
MIQVDDFGEFKKWINDNLLLRDEELLMNDELENIPFVIG